MDGGDGRVAFDGDVAFARVRVDEDDGDVGSQRGRRRRAQVAVVERGRYGRVAARSLEPALDRRERGGEVRLRALRQRAGQLEYRRGLTKLTVPLPHPFDSSQVRRSVVGGGDGPWRESRRRSLDPHIRSVLRARRPHRPR